MNIQLRKIEKEDLIAYRYWMLPQHKYHDFNGPYFRKVTKKEIDEKIKILSDGFDKGIKETSLNFAFSHLSGKFKAEQKSHTI